MKQLMLSGSLLLVCMAVMFYLATDNTPLINHSDLLPAHNAVRRCLWCGLASV